LVAIAVIALIVFMMFSGASDSTAKFYNVIAKNKIIPSLENTDTTCSDGRDNDFDGKIDCKDLTDCNGKFCTQVRRQCPAGTSGGGFDKKCMAGNCIQISMSALCKESNCVDGIDNDKSGATDCADTNCNGQVCKWLTTPPPGAVGPDRTEDICSNKACVPKGPNLWTEIACGDSIDNDLDGLKDCADANCDGLICKTVQVPAGATGSARLDTCTNNACALGGYIWTEVACSDGIDNDVDYKIDGADSDCCPSADLIPTKVTKTYAYNNQARRYDCIYEVFIKNQGSVNADASSYRVELLPPNGGSWTGPDFSMKSLAAGETGSDTFNTPSATQNFTRLGIRADDGSTTKITECDENNNYAEFNNL